MLVAFGVGPEILLQTDLFADLPPETTSWLVERCRWREVTDCLPPRLEVTGLSVNAADAKSADDAIGGQSA